ncbi:MAG: 16S rRNA (cytidine(1402)-2'-O)-methyltransferase [Patescibacteria group bacterium]
MSTLYIVATPIGNLNDITLRALETLRRVSVVYCEDTRLTRRLCERHGIATPMKSYHQHSSSQKVREVIESLRAGDVALVTDAGTPGIADPGNELVHQLTVGQFVSSNTDKQETEKLKDLQIVPVPGPSALTAAASVCGFNMSKFLFLGYVPKKGRSNFFKQVAEGEVPVILYETPHRIVKTLEELNVIVRANGRSPVQGTGLESNSTQPPLKVRGGEGGVMRHRERQVVVCRELTKIYESVYRGTIDEVLAQVRKDPIRGEYVIIIEGEK